MHPAPSLILFSTLSGMGLGLLAVLGVRGPDGLAAFLWFALAFALVAANDQDHMRRFLKNLRTWGLTPAVVVTDGSNLYPGVLAEVWPDADHQLCVFHTVRTQTRIEAARRQPFRLVPLSTS